MNYLTPSDSIGDSLSAISFDYSAIDSRTYYLNASSAQLFDPLENFVNNKFDVLTSLISTTMNNSAKWVDLCTDVSTNSAAWIKPLIYIHKKVLLDSFPITVNLGAVSSTFVQIYPIFSSLPGNVYPSYVETQKAYLYFYTIETINRLNYSQTQTSDPVAHCSCPASHTIIVQCHDYASGMVNCDNGSFSCGSCANSCTKLSAVKCFYENGLNTVDRYLSVTVNAYFDDTYEKNLKCAEYQVKNCNWEFVGYL